MKTVSQILAAAVLITGIMAGAAAIQIKMLSRNLPSASQIRSTILDSYPIRPDAVWMPLTRISTRLQSAVIAWEDPIFYSHRGFNFREIARCALHNIKARAYVRGGSTITQQVAKNLYLTPEKTIRRKIREAILTTRIESALSKREILEIYLNMAHWGPGIAGAETAANKYLNKHADRLSWSEAALLTGMLQNPNALNPEKNPAAARSKQLQVLNKLLKLGTINQAEYDVASLIPKIESYRIPKS